MVWSHLSINQPHLVYAFLGGFTSLFMLCSSVIKERLYIGEATVATLFGIIIGPYAANVINPIEWDGNLDQITLEFSRIILVCQCFAVGVELPKHYCERHWKSLTLLLYVLACATLRRTFYNGDEEAYRFKKGSNYDLGVVGHESYHLVDGAKTELAG